MPKSVVSYDRELPEIPGRCSWLKPDCFLEKNVSDPTGWSVNRSGRRPSELLLISKLRNAVDAWRNGGYEGASEPTKRLFGYWFDEEHEVPGFSGAFRYHFCQREAMETLAYLVEVAKVFDAKAMVDAYATAGIGSLLDKSVEFSTTPEGGRRISRYFPELEKTGIQDLPPENLARYAFKMATGSGKTWVMAMAVVWSYFHKKLVPGSSLSTNFLVVAPNIIVFQRLEKDFGNGDIFNKIPLVPPEWRPFNLKVILRNEAAEPEASGNLFITNIHQIHESRDDEWTPANAIDAILGPKPNKDISSYQRSMLSRVKGLQDLVVINDEAHHVHDEDLAWNKALLGIHAALPKGLSLWLDFSATPKDQSGMFYPWVICDYPLAQAVEDKIVKAPLIVYGEAKGKHLSDDPQHVNRDNVAQKYEFWIKASVDRWKEHSKIYGPLGAKPVLFIMAERNDYADAIGEHLWKTRTFGFKKEEVLVIHTDTNGGITSKDLNDARDAARRIDEAENTYKAIVSVMMLREGWDVRNVTVVLGLRPFTAKAEILPEQVIGRGLRKMIGIGPDIQTLEVLGSKKLLDHLREQLEQEGVGVGSQSEPPKSPVTIYPVDERKKWDIVLPLTKPTLTRVFEKLDSLNVNEWGPIYDEKSLAEQVRVDLKMEFATTRTEVHQAELSEDEPWLPQDILASITNKAIEKARLKDTNRFALLYPFVRDYIAGRCFGREIDLEKKKIRTRLSQLELQEGIAEFLGQKFGKITLERRELQFEKADFRLSHTKEFVWRRNLPPLEAGKTVFNYVATYNDFERGFALFLVNAKDVARFASLGTTEQGESGTEFKVDYLKPSGAIGFYHPDWIVVQKTADGEVHWIIETKGRVWEGTKEKDEAIGNWCRLITEKSGKSWKYARVNQRDFERLKPSTLEGSVAPFLEEEKELNTNPG